MTLSVAQRPFEARRPFEPNRTWDFSRYGFNKTKLLPSGDHNPATVNTVCAGAPGARHYIVSAERARHMQPFWERWGLVAAKRNIVEVFHPRDCNQECEFAREAYKHFHGKASENALETGILWPPPQILFNTLGELAKPSQIHVVGLGELLEIGYEDQRTLKDMQLQFRPPYPLLASDYGDLAAEELYITQADYQVPVHKDRICGPLTYVTYMTVKSFDKFEPTPYKHRFSEPWPMLAHSDDGRQLYIFRDQSEFSIDDSNGISRGIVG